ncbi:MAG: carbohydrate binding domain-containing protein [Odoribacteraceae bacterium]|jgi:alpha-L-arabinofuranosidase|nr:carbohydrate binding domain-containing protein [Odoribacteraceae bacterium]
MKHIIYHSIACLALLCLAREVVAQEAVELRLDTRKAGAVIHPTMYGLFFEDINFAADGGLYAELVKNRSFDFPQPLMGWKSFGNVKVTRERPLFERNPNHVILSYPGHDHKHTGLENEGFVGMGFKENAAYRFSVWAKNMNPAGPQKIRVELINTRDYILAREEITIDSPGWKKYSVTLRSRSGEPKGRLRVFLASRGSVALEHVSLFPVETYKGRENGLRADLATMLEALEPGIFRFPGGCIVEGTDLATRYNWKNSVGLVENRPVNENRWHYTFADRLFPDYFQSYGLGFYEFFLLSEDIGAEPLPVLSCGLACQFQNNGEECHVPVDALDDYIRDALDLIEFANGDPSTAWGKLRAEMGHPAPFHLKYIAIGNEQWGPEYVTRLAPFVKAIRAKYPAIKIVGSAGPYAEGGLFDYLWPEMKRLNADLVDEHYYKDPAWFLKNAARYDAYDRKGPAVFAGEYACHMPNRANNFASALCEAAFMTGLERNADLVQMATYAPLFAHVEAWQWRPDLIWFDNTRAVATPNYYVQQLFSLNKGTRVMPLTLNGKPATGADGLYASAVRDDGEKCYIVKVVNTAEKERPVQVLLDNLKRGTRLRPEVHVTTLRADGNQENTLDDPAAVTPVTSTLPLNGNAVQFSAPPASFSVYKVAYE